MVPAFEVALSLFADYDAHRAAGFQPELDDHWMWYITNGHLQCADCICYPEIGDPDFYQARVHMYKGKLSGPVVRVDFGSMNSEIGKC